MGQILFSKLEQVSEFRDSLWEKRNLTLTHSVPDRYWASQYFDRYTGRKKRGEDMFVQLLRRMLKVLEVQRENPTTDLEFTNAQGPQNRPLAGRFSVYPGGVHTSNRFASLEIDDENLNDVHHGMPADIATFHVSSPPLSHIHSQPLTSPHTGPDTVTTAVSTSHVPPSPALPHVHSGPLTSSHIEPGTKAAAVSNSHLPPPAASSQVHSGTLSFSQIVPNSEDPVSSTSQSSTPALPHVHTEPPASSNTVLDTGATAASTSHVPPLPAFSHDSTEPPASSHTVPDTEVTAASTSQVSPLPALSHIHSTSLISCHAVTDTEAATTSTSPRSSLNKEQVVQSTSPQQTHSHTISNSDTTVSLATNQSNTDLDTNDYSASSSRITQNTTGHRSPSHKKSTHKSSQSPPPVSGLQLFVHRTKNNWRSTPNMQSKTSILGDSNISRATSVRSKSRSVECHSFPGSKLVHFTEMFSREQPQQDSPENIILSVGINNRDNVRSTHQKQVRELLKAASKKFPTSNIFLAKLNIPPKLTTKQTQSLELLNEVLVEEVRKFPKCQTLPGISNEKFQINPSDRYNIHWTEETANSILSHWLECLN